MNKEWFLTMLGFAQRAGKIAAGESAVENFLKRGSIHLMISASDYAEKSVAAWEKQAKMNEIPFYKAEATKSELGQAIGMSARGIVAVMDMKMAEAIMNRIQ